MTVKVTKPAVNVREKLSELDKPSGIAGQDILKADTSQEVFNYIGAGRRNLIINGGFEISQRGDYSSNTSTGQNEYRIDRWKHLVASVTCNTRRDVNQTVNGELMNVWRMEATSTASGRFGIRQYVEATSTGRTPTAGKPTTLSVWMRSNNPNSRIYVYDYGTPGILNSNDSHSGSGQWEKLSITFIPSTGSVTANSNGLELNFVCTTASNGNVNVTSGDYIEIAQPQLELGKVATPFEYRSYGEELALCQRYYQNSFDAGEAPTHNSLNAVYRYIEVYSGTAVAGLDVSFPVVMRATPTCTLWTASPSSNTSTGRITFYDGSSWSNDVAGIHESTSSKRISVLTSNASSTTKLVQFNFEADAEL